MHVEFIQGSQFLHSCSGQSSLSQDKSVKNWRRKAAVKYSRAWLFSTVVKVSIAHVNRIWKSDYQWFSQTFRFVFVKQLLYFLCLQRRPRISLSCEAVAVSEGCLHQLWRGTHSSPDKGKDANLRILAAVSPAWWFHVNILGNGRKEQVDLPYSIRPQKKKLNGKYSLNYNLFWDSSLTWSVAVFEDEDVTNLWQWIIKFRWIAQRN